VKRGSVGFTMEIVGETLDFLDVTIIKK